MGMPEPKKRFKDLKFESLGSGTFEAEVPPSPAAENLTDVLTDSQSVQTELKDIKDELTKFRDWKQYFSSMETHLMKTRQQISDLEERIDQQRLSHANEGKTVYIRSEKGRDSDHFLKRLEKLENEIRYLRKGHPIEALIRIKEKELRRNRVSLKRLSSSHPDRELIERIVLDKEQEISELEKTFQETVAVLDIRLDEIEDLRQQLSPPGDHSPPPAPVTDIKDATSSS